MHILIIEDNVDIVANLYGFFEPLGYTLDVARTGTSGLAHATSAKYDVIVLDLSLPGMDGMEVCRRMREEHRVGTPVLMLTARDTVQDKWEGFEAGADDYLVKPFSMVELNARLRALVRRARKETVPDIISFGDIRIDMSIREACRKGRLLPLTPTAYTLLVALTRAAPRLVPRETLMRELWGDEPPESDSLRTHIHTLRHALDDSFEHPMLKTVPGAGYRLVANDEK